MSDQPTAPADDPMNPGGVSTPGEAITGGDGPDGAGRGPENDAPEGVGPPVDPAVGGEDDDEPTPGT